MAGGACTLFENQPVVGFLGDSITVQTATALEQRAPEDWQVDIRARSGVTIAEMSGEAARLGAEGPEAVVLNLGTNDVLRGVPPEQSAADLELLLDQLGNPSCVLLMTVHENIVTDEEGSLLDRARATNAALAAVAERRGVRLVDWTEHLARQQAQPDAPELLIDTVHLSTDGVDDLVGLYLASLGDRCGPPTASL